MRYTYKVSVEGASKTGPLGYTAYCCPYPVAGGLATKRGASVLFSHAEYDTIMLGAPENTVSPTSVYSSNLYSMGSITCVPVADLVDGEEVTINNGERSETFEFDKTGNGVTAGNIAVDVSTLTTAIEVAAAFMAAINTSAPYLGVAAQNSANATFYIVNRIPGARGEAGLISDTVADEDFAVSQFGNSRDVVPVCWGGRVYGFQNIGAGVVEDEAPLQ